MRKKFKTFINLFVLFFVIFYPVKSSASSLRCNLFVDTLSSLESGGYEFRPTTPVKNFGFDFKYIYDPKTNEFIKQKDENGNFLVGKINNLDLAKSLKSGNSIIKLNGEKYIADKKQNKIYSENDKIKFEFFDHEKGKFILDLERKTEMITDVLLDITDISINEINIKKGFYDMHIVYDYSLIFNKESHKKLWDVIDGTMLFKRGDNWSYTTCKFTKEEFKKSTLVDPGNGIVFLNVAKKDKDLIDVYYYLTPYSEKVGNDRNSLYLEKKIEGVYLIRDKFNLRSFPFDKQKLSLTIVDDQYRLFQRQIHPTSNTFESLQNYIDKNDISGWNIKDFQFDNIQHQNPFFQEKDFADGLKLNLIIERKHGYYIFKVIIPIVLILMICWSVVWIHPRELESRLTITIVCLLSLIAYNFVIDEELPKLEYLTVLDWIILVSYFYAAIPNFLTIASFRFFKTNEQLSIKLENYGKKYGPTSYVLIIFVIILINANLNPENSSALISWMAARQ